MFLMLFHLVRRSFNIIANVEIMKFFIFIWLCGFICGTKCFDKDLVNVLALTENFFSNLNQIDFGNQINDTKEFIDHQIKHYVDLVETAHGLNSNSKFKRSMGENVLSMDFVGVHVLNGFFNQTRIPVRNPVDINLFKHDFGSTEVWYAATLQSLPRIHEHDVVFVLYKYEDEAYIEISNIIFSNALKIASYTLYGLTYIIVAETNVAHVFLFDLEENLTPIHTIDVQDTSSIEFWNLNDAIFMAITQINDNALIFSWNGEQFKFVQNIKTNNARKIISFSIEDEKFLAIANHQNNKGQTDIFSEIYKYDKQVKMFRSYQHILTHAAVDIKYFCFRQNHLRDVFLIVANSYEKDFNGNINYETNSIVYKYVEDYFLPFQSFKLDYIQEWLPAVGPNGEFILLASCKNSGITAFQYDGWRFVESEIQYRRNAFGKGINSLQSYLYKDQQLIVVANENDHGNMQNVFAPTFSYQNIMNEFQKGMHEWCQKTLKELDFVDLKELNRFVEEAPKLDDPEINLNSIYFHNVTIYNLVLDDENYKTKRIKKRQISYLEKEIDEKTEQLQKINEKLNNTKNEPIILRGNIQIRNLELDSDRIVFEDLHTKSINNIQLDKFYNDVFFLDDPFDLTDNLQFEDLIFDGYIHPKFVNNIPVSDLVYTNSNISFANLIIDGSLKADDLFVNGLIDDLPINENEILLIEGNQVFEQPIQIAKIQTDNLFVNHINSLNMFTLTQNRVVDIAEHSIDTLSVKNITIGYINGMDMRSLQTLVFAKNGEQELTSNYEFDTLIVDDVEIEGLLSNTSIENLTYTTGHTNKCLQSIIFAQDVEMDYLYAMERINQIKSVDGSLDVLLKDHPGVQYITGPKTFESINLLGPIPLRGQIDIKGLEPPIIEKKLILDGDYEIKGTTIIETSFKFGDLVESSGDYSMERLEKSGLKLDETEIPVHLDFAKEIIVDKIYVEEINEKNIKSWIIFDDDIHEISGQKTFSNNLNINGNVSIQSINGYKLTDLYENILKINGDQHITGKHVYDKISLVRIVSNRTSINNTPWKNIMTLNKDEIVNGTTILTKPVKISKFETKSAKLKNILKYNFDEMIEDTLFNDTIKKVTGNKIFEDKLTFQNLTINRINNIELNQIVEQINIWLNDIQINKPIKINSILEVDNVYFNNLNGLSNKDFGKVWLLRNGQQVIEKDQFFTKSNVKNKVTINKNVINDINVEEINRKAIKINEKHQIKTVEFVNNIKSAFINLKGTINDVNINDAVISNGLKNQTILSRKILHKNLTVGGHLHINGHLSGLNLRAMEDFTSSNTEKNINVIIDGCINFKNAFDVYNLNNKNIKEISKNVWYTDKKTEVQGFVSFENVVFEDDLTVNGYVDDIELVWLSKNYFSKTKNQKITAKLDFIDGIVFGKDLKAENANIVGRVANISIQKFNEHILRNDDQVFDFHVLFDDLEVTRKFDTIFVNNLNLEKDVMRFDRQENIVTGFKSIQNLKAIDLNLEKGRKLQNVDVDNWFKNAVFTSGNFTIDALKILKNAKFEKNIQLDGLLNSFIFDEEHIVTTHTKQKITGQKNFITSGPLIHSSVVFDILKLKGFYNNIDIQKLIDIQIDKSKENIPIAAKKHFFKTIIANNVNIKHLFQNVDISDLVKNISNLPKFNSYETEYGKLIDFSKNILQVLKQQPYFIRSFKQIQKIPFEKITKIFSFETFLVLMKISGKTAKLSIYKWDFVSNNFKFEKEIVIQQNFNIVYGTIVTLNEETHLYLEEVNEQSGFSHLGTIYKLSIESFDISNRYLVATLGTNSLTSFTLPNLNKNCLVNLQLQDNTAFINCEMEKNIFTFIQKIDAVNGQKILSMDIQNTPHLFLLNFDQNQIDNTLEILRFSDNEEIKFNIHDTLQIKNVVNFDVISYKNNYYLALVIKHNTETENPGSVIIYKYDLKFEKFTIWQTIEAMDPTQVKFSILTTKELILNVLSNCPSEPFTIYQYNGIAGFNKNYGSSTIPIVTDITTFSTKYSDVVVVYNSREIRVIQGLYEGKKIY